VNVLRYAKLKPIHNFEKAPAQTRGGFSFVRLPALSVEPLCSPRETG